VDVAEPVTCGGFVRDTLAAKSRLLGLFIIGAFTNAEMDYIGSCLELNENLAYQNEAIADFIFEFSRQDINGPYSICRAEEIVSHIGKT
jgi:hypothetical protein